MKKDSNHTRITAAFTIIARNYTAHATLLVESLNQQNPEWDMFVFFVDDLKVRINKAVSQNIGEIEIPQNDELRLKYSLYEYSTAVKPWVFSYLFKKKYKNVLYLDPDIFVYKPLSELERFLETNDAVVTPHISEPYSDDLMPSLRDFLQVGIYNLGFVGLSNSDHTSRFVHWWGTQLLDFCFSRPESFQFTDQKWMDYAPAFLKTKILRSEGYNIAYWNLHEYINQNKPIFFIHYSGFTKKSGMISKYQNRFSINALGKYSSYYNSYFEALQKKQGELVKLYEGYEYPYDFFPNSSMRMSPPIRNIYDYVIKNIPSHRQQIDGSRFLDYLLSRSDGDFPNILILLYKTQPLIRREFSIFNWSNPVETRPYIQWLFKFGFAEFEISHELVYKIATKLHFDNKVLASFSFNPLQILFLPIDQFLTTAYKRLLFRNIDEVGLERNLSDYERGFSNKFTLLYKILKSNEYKEKNAISSRYYLSLYFYALLGMPPLLRSKFLGIKTKHRLRQDKPSRSNFGVNMAGYFTTESGVADSARGILSALDYSKTPVHVLNISQEYLRSNNKTVSSRFTEKHNYFVNLLCVNADQTVHVQTSSLPHNYISNKYNIGYWYWESNIFPNEYLEAFSNLREVWVATSYVQEIIAQISPIPVVKIPPAFTFEKAKPFNFAKHGIKLPNNSVLALQLFDSGSFVERKNPQATFAAFEIAVRKNSNLHLLIKTTLLKDHPDVQQQFDEFKNKTPNVHYLDGYLSQDEIESLIQSCQIYISLHRCEGLGIPLIKAMLAGIPTIATDFGGNTDFMNSSNSFLVNYLPYILNKDVGPYKKGTVWAEADYEQAAEMLLNLSLNPTKMPTKTVTEYFSQKRVSTLITQRLLSVFF